MSVLGILCYHRLVADERADLAWPYFERGTAVRVSTFRAQLDALVHFADLLDERAAIDALAGRRRSPRPAVWITFDDGYTDVKQAARWAPRGTIFVTTGASARMLPADAWYAALLAATRRRGVVDLGLGPFEFDLTHREGRARLVDGPERRAYLRAPEATQESTLRSLTAQLKASAAPSALYLASQDLLELVRDGWTVGSHGVTHASFDVIDRDAVQWEATSSRGALAALGISARSIALPDGARGQHLELLHHAGYDCVLGLGDEPAVRGGPVHPRFLVPDDPHWVAGVLQPALARRSQERNHG